MAIPIELEDPQLYKETKVYEDCVFCGAECKYWQKRTNNPVCPICAKSHKVSELTNWKKRIK